VSDRLGRAVLELVTDVEGFRADVQTIRSETGSLIGEVQKMAGVAAAAFAALDISGAANAAVESASEVADASARWGIGIEAVQRLAFAAQQGGASLDDVGTGIKTMSSHLVEGDKSAVAALSALGLNLDELRSMAPEQAFTTIADAIREIPDPMHQSALAVDLFGKSGDTLLPAIKAGITEVGNAAAVMKTTTVESLDATGDKWDEVQGKLNTLKAEALAPVLDLFLELPTGLQTVAGGIAAFMPNLATLATGLLAIGGPSGAMALLSTAGAAIVTFLTATLPAAFSAILPFLGPVGLIAAGVAAVIVVWKNWETITAFVMGVYTAVKEWLVDKFAAVVKWIGEKVAAVTGFFKNMYTAVVGSSYVPDMMNGIQVTFARLQPEMVAPTEAAATSVMTIVGNMGAQVGASMAGMSAATATTVSEIAASLAQAGRAHDQYGQDVKDKNEDIQGSFQTTMKGVGEIFGTLGRKYKVFAIAEAIISALMYVAKTLATGVWPFNLAQAAGALAAGMAVVAKIRGAATPAFAEGGIVTRPLMGLLGEAGTEAIIPLDRLESLIGGGRETVIHVHTHLDGRELAHDMVRHMPRALALAGLV
jgi:hypothetical protein